VIVYSVETIQDKLIRKEEERLILIEKCNAILSNAEYSREEKIMLIIGLGESESWAELFADRGFIDSTTTKGRIKEYKKQLLRD